MSCNEALRVHAYVDGELDAAAAAEIERHLETCPDCSALLKDIEETRSALREGVPYHRASNDLRERIAAAWLRSGADRKEPISAPNRSRATSAAKRSCTVM